ncbi:YqaE/Pmp3 family membrane protein [Paenibacillus sp. D2_2]|uniref:YqaE/Pmp3 family membrane protein n=1 Tax=Paenibacillus sp. D2_2 TaxID=3073092 RepID=UPI0028169140|nr:YqaE/Pmp3 family membrane protein [Paenibacillus sp. D2_2]WMT39745.1 YqaE/Pmp3 family membrane protein [Paenibacillus sp. D2_2]
MLYFLCFLLPPLAVLFCGKPGSFLLNILLCIFGYIPGVVHAFLVVNSHKADKRNKELIRAMQQGRY